jgi:AmpD protein
LSVIADHYEIENHWLRSCRHCHSPNQSARPEGGPIDLLVIHNISLPPGEFGTGCVDQLFCNQLDPARHSSFPELMELRVSAHLLIDRSAEITQFVSFDRKAWHAGISRFSGRENCNDFSIGIELEGTDDRAYTESQYSVLIQITRLLVREYPLIAPDRIVGHSDIAPGRKTDPGSSFDWRRFRDGIEKLT